MDALLEARNLVKVYQTGAAPTPALRGVSLAVRRGEFLSIMGPSGCGKSTLLYLLGLLATPTEGTVFLAGTDTRAVPDGRRTLLRRRHIGFVFQRFNLLPTLSAEDNVALALRLRGRPAGTHARQMLAAVGLEEKRRRRPGELSVGQQQRVAIARALVTHPDVLLADEPTGNLDSESSERILALLGRFHADEGQTVILITHNEKVAAQAERLVRMRDGRLLDA